jgi:hypothetical protein
VTESAVHAERVVSISEAVAEEWARAARLHEDGLSGGLLIGTPPTDAISPVRVTGYLDMTPRESVLGMLMDLKREWRRLQQRVAAVATRDALIGWVFVGAAEELMLTPQVQLLHRSLFNLPWHIGIVVDAANEEIACFGMDEARRLRNVHCEISSGASPPSKHPNT